MENKGETSMTENWRDVPGYEGYYQVSDQGHVRSLTRRLTPRYVRRRNGSVHVEQWVRKGKILKPIQAGCTLVVHLVDDRKHVFSVPVKRLVAMAWLADYRADTPTRNIRKIDSAKGWEISNMYIAHNA